MYTMLIKLNVGNNPRSDDTVLYFGLADLDREDEDLNLVSSGEIH